MSGKNKKHKLSFVFFIGDEGAVLTVADAKGKVSKRLFSPSADSDAMEPIRKALYAAPEAPVSVLLDTIDQSYQIQQFPPVSRFGVEKLVKARLNRDLAPEDIKGYLNLGRQQDGRKDWRFLIISIANSPVLMQWLDFILDLENPFRSIYLVPIESQRVIETLLKSSDDELKADWQLLVMHNKSGGFRQVITHQGKMAFTRLTQNTPEPSSEVIAGALEQEIANTLEYLKRLSFREGDKITAHVVASNEIMRAIDPKKIAVNNFQPLSPVQFVQKLTLDAEEFKNDHFCDVAFSAFFATTKKPVLSFDTSFSRKVKQMALLANAVRYSAIALTFLLVCLAGYFANHWFSERDDIETLERKLRQQKEELSKSEALTQLLPKDIDRISDVVTLHQTFPPQIYLPQRFVDLLKMIDLSGILLRQIKWESPTNFDNRAKAAPQPVKISFKAFFYSEVKSPEQRIEQITNFINALKERFDEYTVTHDKIPGTYTESENVTFNFDDATAQSRLLRSVELNILLSKDMDKAIREMQ